MHQQAIVPDDSETYAYLIRQFGRSTDQSPEQRWPWLMAAHIMGQQRLGLHLHSHLIMLRLAVAERDWPEVAGQVLRLLLVPLGNGTGRLPLGNVGRATVSAFEPMPVAASLRRLISEAREAARAQSSPPKPAN